MTLVNLATGEKVSMKYNISYWLYPLATNLALQRSMEPSNLYLILYTHLKPIGFLYRYKLVRIHELFFSKVDNSDVMAYCQWENFSVWW